MVKKKQKKKCAISVTGKTYEALRRVAPSRGMARIVDGLILSALEDPAFLARLDEQLRRAEGVN